MSHPVCNPFTLHLPMAFAAATELEVELPGGQLVKVHLNEVRCWLEHRERQRVALKPVQKATWPHAFQSEEVLHGGA